MWSCAAACPPIPIPSQCFQIHCFFDPYCCSAACSGVSLLRPCRLLPPAAAAGRPSAARRPPPAGCSPAARRLLRPAGGRLGPDGPHRPHGPIGPRSKYMCQGGPEQLYVAFWPIRLTGTIMRTEKITWPPSTFHFVFHPPLWVPLQRGVAAEGSLHTGGRRNYYPYTRKTTALTHRLGALHLAWLLVLVFSS